MFERCVVPGCRILSGKGVGLFDFPNGSHNTRRRALWLKNLGLSESDLSSLSRVCERHFGPGNIVVYPSGGCRLMAGAVPNIIRETSMQTFDDSKSSASSKEISTAIESSKISQSSIEKSAWISKTGITVKQEPKDEEERNIFAAIRVKEEDQDDESIPINIKMEPMEESNTMTTESPSVNCASSSTSSTSNTKPDREMLLTEYCRHVISHNHHAFTPIPCYICGVSLQRIWDVHEGIQVNIALSHALSHLNVSLFQCRFCDFGSVSQYPIMDHLRRAHNILNGTSAHYVESTNEQRAEICHIIDRCFGKKTRIRRLLPVSSQHSQKQAPQETVAYDQCTRKSTTSRQWRVSAETGRMYNLDSFNDSSSPPVLEAMIQSENNSVQKTDVLKNEVGIETADDIQKEDDFGILMVDGPPLVKRILLRRCQAIPQSYKCKKCEYSTKYRKLLSQHYKKAHA